MKKGVVSDFFFPPSDWNLHLRRNLRDPVIQEYAELLAIPLPFQPFASRSDSRTWTISPSGIFSVSSFSSAISSNPVAPTFPCETLWFPLSPTKFQGFLWKIAGTHGPILDVIQSFYPYLTLLQTLVPFASQRKRPIITCSFTVRSAGNDGANCLSF